MPKLKIKKGDNVVVITGRDKGKSGEVLRVFPTESRLVVQGVNCQAPHPASSMGKPGGIVEKEADDPRLQRRPYRPEIRQADPGRLQDPRGRPQGPRRPPLRRSARHVRIRSHGMTRLQEHYDNVVHAGLMKEFGYANPMQVPRLDKIVINMGVGEAVQDAQEDRRRGRRPDRDHRPAPGGDHGQDSRSPPSSCARTCRSAAR